MRTFTNINQHVNELLSALADKTTDITRYRQSFVELGEELGFLVRDELESVDANEIMLACASEDADWLASGVMEGVGKGDLPISVFWSTRTVVYQSECEKLEISAIEKSYEEPIEKCSVLIIVKSIINSSCVVKTQLTRLIGKIHPEKVFILAPVMYKDGKPNLLKEFPQDISSKFQFYTFAIDDECSDSGEVVPGVGGMVYPRLGLGDATSKNKYIPQLVQKGWDAMINDSSSWQIKVQTGTPASHSRKAEGVG